MRDAPGGMIENVYRLQFINTDEKPHRYSLTVSGFPGLELTNPLPIEVPATTTKAFPVAVRADPKTLKHGSHAIVFHIHDVDRTEVRSDEASRFYVK